MLRCILITGGLAACLATTAVHAGKGGIPGGVVPWQQPQYWPYSYADSAHFVVHYQKDNSAQLAMAQKVAGFLETAWTRYVVDFGLPEPLSDNGVAGPDGRMDVYLWYGMGGFYVDAVAPNLETSYDDWSTFIALDPASSYAASDAELEANLFHEFRHCIQAVDDWWEHIFAFESDATVFEAREHGFGRLPFVWADYQANPHWGLFRDDGYRTWYMYGGALFFEFLSQTRYEGTTAFLDQMWGACQNPPGAGENPVLNEPDFCDALHLLLGGQGTSLEAQILEFARARWYTGSRYNAAIFPLPSDGPQAVPAVASVLHKRNKNAKATKVTVSPMVLGTSYVEVMKASTDGASLSVSLQGASGVRYAVRVVGTQTEAGDYPITDWPAEVAFRADGKFTLGVTVLPAQDVSLGFDPDTQTDTGYSAQLTFQKGSTRRR